MYRVIYITSLFTINAYYPIMKRYLQLIFAAWLLLSLSACGLKGPLYHPSDDQTSNINVTVTEFDRMA